MPSYGKCMHCGNEEGLSTEGLCELCEKKMKYDCNEEEGKRIDVAIDCGLIWLGRNGSDIELEFLGNSKSWNKYCQIIESEEYNNE